MSPSVVHVTGSLFGGQQFVLPVSSLQGTVSLLDVPPEALPPLDVAPECVV